MKTIFKILFESELLPIKLNIKKQLSNNDKKRYPICMENIGLLPFKKKKKNLIAIIYPDATDSN